VTSSRTVVFILFGFSLGISLFSGNPLFFRLSYLFGLLILISWILSKLSLRGIRFKRSTRTLRSQVGQIFEEQYEIGNSAKYPRFWIEVKDESKLPGSRGSHILTLIGKKEGRTYLARTRLRERGVFQLGPTTLSSGDLFGLFPVSRTFIGSESLLVYPLIVQVKSFPNPPGLLPGGEALRRRTPQITPNASGVREYIQGDPLSRIHWLSTARRDRLMVKEFELDPLADVWLFLDASRAAQSCLPQPEEEVNYQEIWSKRFKFNLPPTTIEYAVTSAGSLARYYLQRGRAVGLVSASTTLRVLPCDRGGRQLGKILEALALIHGDGLLPLEGLVEAQAKHLPRGSTIVLITPTGYDILYKISDMLLRRGLRPVVVAINAASFGGTIDNTMVVESLKVIGVPVCVINNGNDLTEVLSI
jgi:uncharacterized protein (DUF58 family)